MTIENSHVEYPRPEIVNTPERTIIINRVGTNHLDIDYILRQISGGAPFNWGKYLPFKDKGARIKYCNLDYLFTDHNTCFIAKVRRLTDLHKNKYRGVCGQSLRRTDLAMASVLSEFVVSPIVSEALESPQMRRLAEEYGFRSFELVPPIMATIERPSQKKIAYYPYKEGVTLDMVGARQFLQFFPRQRTGFQNELISQMSDIFRENGVEASDLQIKQFIIPVNEGLRQRKIYLIDIEGFHRISHLPVWH